MRHEPTLRASCRSSAIPSPRSRRFKKAEFWHRTGCRGRPSFGTGRGGGERTRRYRYRDVERWHLGFALLLTGARLGIVLSFLLLNRRRGGKGDGEHVREGQRELLHATSIILSQVVPSIYSFIRVMEITDILSQNVPLEDVQYLTGHSNPSGHTDL